MIWRCDVCIRCRTWGHPRSGILITLRPEGVHVQRCVYGICCSVWCCNCLMRTDYCNGPLQILVSEATMLTFVSSLDRFLKTTLAHRSNAALLFNAGVPTILTALLLTVRVRLVLYAVRVKTYACACVCMGACLTARKRSGSSHHPSCGSNSGCVQAVWVIGHLFQLRGDGYSGVGGAVCGVHYARNSHLPQKHHGRGIPPVHAYAAS